MGHVYPETKKYEQELCIKHCSKHNFNKKFLCIKATVSNNKKIYANTDKQGSVLANLVTIES